MKNRLGVKGIRRLLSIQWLISLLMSLAFLVIYGEKEAMSSVLAGFVAIIPSFFFARQLFRHQGARAAKQIVRSFYLGEALKIILSVVLFALVFTTYNIAPLPFFFTYIVVLMSYWLAPLIVVNERTRVESD